MTRTGLVCCLRVGSECPVAAPSDHFTLQDKTNALAQPTAIAFGPSGANYYLAAFGSDRVARVDANSGNITARIELCSTAIGSASATDTTRKNNLSAFVECFDNGTAPAVGYTRTLVATKWNFVTNAGAGAKFFRLRQQ